MGPYALPLIAETQPEAKASRPMKLSEVSIARLDVLSEARALIPAVGASAGLSQADDRGRYRPLRRRLARGGSLADGEWTVLTASHY